MLGLHPLSSLPLSSLGSRLSGWSITGIKRFTNVAKYTGQLQYAMLFATLTDTAGVRTVSLFQGVDANGILVASGFLAGDGVVTLSEENNSGISGTVTVAYSGDTSTVLTFLWPKSYQIHFNPAPLIFPRTPEATLDDDGESNLFGFVTERQAVSFFAGVGILYHTAIVPVSETGIADGPTTGSVGLFSLPIEPIRLTWKSGDSTNTVIRWTSPDPTYDYHVYLSTLDGAIDMSNPTSVAGGAGEITFAVPSLGAGVTGVLRIIVRSVSPTAGPEEKNSSVLSIFYKNGVRSTPAPARAGVTRIVVTAGRTVTVSGEYDSRPPGSAAAARINLYLSESLGHLYDTIAASIPLPALSAGTCKFTIAATGLVDGWHYVAVRAVALDDTPNTDSIVYRILLSNSAPNTVGNFDNRVSRGG